MVAADDVADVVEEEVVPLDGFGSSPTFPKVSPECAVQVLGMLLFLYQPTALSGQPEVAKFPLDLQ